jgi:CRISPR-associated protein Csh1
MYPDIIYTKFMDIIKEKYNKDQSVHWAILESHMVLNYFQQIEIITYNKNYKFEVNMNNEEQNDIRGKKKSIDIEKLTEFIKTNPGFFDQDYKVGIFSVGILIRQILNIQSASLGNTPFEKKLRGYDLNPEILRKIYLEALDKISQYQSFFAYSNLREFINKYFTLNSHLLNKISNNEISYYFVAGLEMGNNFKTEKEI